MNSLHRMTGLWAPRIEMAILFAVFATLPQNGIMALKRLLLLFLVIAAGTYARREHARPNIPPVTWIWFALAPLSLLWSVDPQFTRSELLADAAYPLLAMLSAGVLCQGRLHYRAAESGLLTGIAITLAIGFSKAVSSGDVRIVDWYGLAHGMGQFSTVLAIVLPIAMAFGIAACADRRPVALALAAVLVAAICVGGYAMQNRMFWLTAIMSTAIVMGFAAARPEFREQRRKLFLIAGSFVAMLGTIYYAVARIKPASYLNASPVADNTVAAAFTQNERFEMWRFWVERIAEQPWLGIGFGHDLPRLTYAGVKPAHWPDLLFAHAHNMFVDVAVQLGLLGLAVLVTTLVAIALRLVRAARQSDLATAMIAVAGLAAMAAMLAKNMTDDFFSRGPLFAFWIIVGAMLARTHQGEK